MPKERLSAARVFEVALALADVQGLGAVSMRGLARALGVEAMSLYHHVKNKAAILDGMIDAVFAEIDLPAHDVDWRTGLRARSVSARDVLRRHPWAVGLLDSRQNAGPAVLRHHDAVIGCLRRGGFSLALTGHAFSLVDSYVYGFVLQEQSLPFDSAGEFEAVATELLAQMGTAYPHLAEFAGERVLTPEYDYGAEFEWGLDLLLDGLAQRLAADGLG